MAGKIIIVGLGAGEIDQLPLGVYRKLRQAQQIYVRTAEHPVVTSLIAEHIPIKSFDDYYESHSQFQDVYEAICETLLNKALNKTILYAVPGHPLVAEKTVQLLLENCTAKKITVQIDGGHSFIDAIFQSLTIDPVDGFQLLDGTSLRHQDLNLQQHLIIAQVYDQFVASDVKLTLMEKLPDDYEIKIITAAGTSFESVQEVPLYLLDRELKFSNLTSVYVPPVTDERLLYKQFNVLQDVIAKLRGPDGCPWDRRQTHQSLKKYLLEETYEVLEAIEGNNINNLIEELGDLLLQIMLHAQIGADDGYFNIDDVIETLTTKMIRRHPHVFGGAKIENETAIKVAWEEIKAAEAREKGIVKKESIMANINATLPNLLKALEVQQKAAKVGFDWDQLEPMIEKVIEEWSEFNEQLERKDNHEEIQREFGDLLFALVNVARFLNINPEEALFQTILKFKNRFNFVEQQVSKSGRPFADYTLSELDLFWEQAKQQGI